jgi:hypothetical protein
LRKKKMTPHMSIVGKTNGTGPAGDFVLPRHEAEVAASA